MDNILLISLALTTTVIESKEVRKSDNAVIVSVRPYKRQQRRCPVCGKKRPAYDRLNPRFWRAMDMGVSVCYLTYQPSRVRCPEHGIHTEDVPWARHGSRYTRDFEDHVAWLAVSNSISITAELARIEWHTVGNICKRVIEDLKAKSGQSRFDNLRCIGIDETGYRHGRRLLTVIVDHDRECLIWVHEGYSKDVLKKFFKLLTKKQRKAIRTVTADGLKWVKTLVRKQCPNAVWVMDPFHVVSWMNDALETIRQKDWRAVNRAAVEATPEHVRVGRPKKGEETPREARELKAAARIIQKAKYAVLKNPENLTDSQRELLDGIIQAGSDLAVAWMLKELLRAVFKTDDLEEAAMYLDAWLVIARDCGMAAIIKVYKKVLPRYDDILAAVKLNASNARTEAINNKIKLTVRMGYGYKNVDNLIAMLMLRCSDIRPTLPGRVPREPKAREQKAA